ncbi:MAG: hypothetical protein Q7R83_01155 [bacterium]|nr:hypothetical protein [bacterium]
MKRKPQGPGHLTKGSKRVEKLDFLWGFNLDRAKIGYPPVGVGSWLGLVSLRARTYLGNCHWTLMMAGLEILQDDETGPDVLDWRFCVIRDWFSRVIRGEFVNYDTKRVAGAGYQFSVEFPLLRGESDSDQIMFWFVGLMQKLRIPRKAWPNPIVTSATFYRGASGENYHFGEILTDRHYPIF